MRTQTATTSARDAEFAKLIANLGLRVRLWLRTLPNNVLLALLDFMEPRRTFH